jgi:hypothetical protein
VSQFDSGISGRPWHTRVMPNPKRPRDPNQRAKLIVDIATGESDEAKAPTPKDPAAVELGRRSGLKGGKARAAKLSTKKKHAIARRAAQVRWDSEK